MTEKPNDAPSSQTVKEAGEKLGRGIISIKDLKVERVVLRLPSMGEVKVYPYISGGAMQAADSATQDEQMLERIFMKSVFPVVDTNAFDEADWDAVARHFLNTEETTESYEEEVKSGYSACKAFATTFKHSKPWKDHERSMRELKRSLESEVEAATRMMRSYENTAASVFAGFDRNQFADMGAETTRLIDQYSIKMPELNLELQTSIDRVLSEVKALSKIRIPEVTFTAPKIDLIGQVEHQLASFRLVSDLQLTSFEQISSLMSPLTMPDFGNVGGLASLNDAIFSSVAQTLATNRLFASVDYLSPQQIRGGLLAPNDNDDWVEEIEEAEEAIVIETLTNQQVINSIVTDRLQQFEKERHLDELPQLRERIESLTKPESFVKVLDRFGKRVAREDSQIFWEEYGSKFSSRPEAIGKSLLGMFLDAYGGGQAFVAHELRVGEGYVDLVVFFQGKTFVVELKVVGPGWGIGKAKLGLEQLGYYDDMYFDADVFLVVFDGRKTTKGERLPDEHRLENGKVARVVSVPIFTIAPTRK
ncbi:hypothetical protein [Novipirellula aureliae]|nr:hypothetical protein [Novipirellula aureliae]